MVIGEQVELWVGVGVGVGGEEDSPRRDCYQIASCYPPLKD